MVTPLDRVRSIHTQLTALVVEAECLVRDLHDGAASAENAIDDMQEALQGWADAAAFEDRRAAFEDALAAGEPSAVSRHRAEVAAERNEYRRETAI